MTDSLLSGEITSQIINQSTFIVTRDEHVSAVLDVLDDDACRAILGATSDGPIHTKRISEETGVPLSTTYRKLGQLADLGLIEERIQIRSSGKHTVYYLLAVERTVVKFDEEGNVTLRLESADDVDGSFAPDAMTKV